MHAQCVHSDDSASPTVGFDLDIKGGTVTKAKLRISGASGLVANFEAAQHSSDSQIDEKGRPTS